MIWKQHTMAGWAQCTPSVRTVTRYLTGPTDSHSSSWDVFSGEEHISPSTSVCKMNGSAGSLTHFIWLSALSISVLLEDTGDALQLQAVGFKLEARVFAAAGLMLVSSTLFIRRLKPNHSASIFIRNPFDPQ